MYSWGKQEWKGAWSDGSPEWDAIPEKDRPENADDGSFWMSMDDFCEQFDALTITRTVNTAILSLERTWNCKSFKGRWEGEMAGGCKNEKDWLAHNPQFIIVQRKTSTVHVSLLQVGHSQREDMLVIGFSVFQIEENRRFRLISQNKIFPQAAAKPEDATVHTNGEEAKGRKSSAKKMMKKLFKSDEDRAARKAGVRGCKSKYINSREVTVSARLRAGTYMIVPTTFKKGEVGDFLLRIYSNEPTEGQVAKSILERTSVSASLFSGIEGLCVPLFCALRTCQTEQGGLRRGSGSRIRTWCSRLKKGLREVKVSGTTIREQAPRLATRSGA